MFGLHVCDEGEFTAAVFKRRRDQAKREDVEVLPEAYITEDSNMEVSLSVDVLEADWSGARPF